MKNHFITFIALCLLAGFAQQLHAQQWLPLGASEADLLFRSGNVGVGTVLPLSQVHLANEEPFFSTEVETKRPSFMTMGFTLPPRPNILLEKRMTNPDGSTAQTLGWIIDGGPTLDFVRGSLATGPERRFSLNETGARVFGSELSVGKASKQINIGYREEGRYVGMGYRSVAGTAFSSLGSGGGAVIFSSPDGKLSIATRDAGLLNTASHARMTIDAQGLVGIGTQSPAAQLHLSGEQAGLRLDGQAGGWWEMLPKAVSGKDAFMLDYAGLGTVLLAKDDGRVAIGTELTPASLGGDDISAYRLFVEGGILSKEVRVRTAWSDYVFAPDYELLPLPEVAAHIAEHGHLHATPSGAHIEASGLELGSMAANQQAKIEELFLHLIEMDARVKALEEENARLKGARKPGGLFAKRKNQGL